MDCLPSPLLYFFYWVFMNQSKYSRHGESMFNTQGLIGGDPPLSPLGEEYAKVLVDYVQQSEELPNDEVCRRRCRFRRVCSKAVASLPSSPSLLSFRK